MHVVFQEFIPLLFPNSFAKHIIHLFRYQFFPAHSWLSDWWFSNICFSLTLKIFQEMQIPLQTRHPSDHCINPKPLLTVQGNLLEHISVQLQDLSSLCKLNKNLPWRSTWPNYLSRNSWYNSSCRIMPIMQNANLPPSTHALKISPSIMRLQHYIAERLQVSPNLALSFQVSCFLETICVSWIHSGSSPFCLSSFLLHSPPILPV